MQLLESVITSICLAPAYQNGLHTTSDWRVNTKKQRISYWTLVVIIQTDFYRTYDMWDNWNKQTKKYTNNCCYRGKKLPPWPYVIFWSKYVTLGIWTPSNALNVKILQFYHHRNNTKQNRMMDTLLHFFFILQIDLYEFLRYGEQQSLCLFTKNGEERNPTNYCPISLLRVINKSLCKVFKW